MWNAELAPHPGRAWPVVPSGQLLTDLGGDEVASASPGAFLLGRGRWESLTSDQDQHGLQPGGRKVDLGWALQQPPQFAGQRHRWAVVVPSHVHPQPAVWEASLKYPARVPVGSSSCLWSIVLHVPFAATRLLPCFGLLLPF